MKVKVTKEGLLIPKEVTDRALDSSDEVEIVEEPGRLLIVAEPGTSSLEDTECRWGPRRELGEDPILGLGRSPVRTGAGDGSMDHDRYLYGAGD